MSQRPDVQTEEELATLLADTLLRTPTQREDQRVFPVWH